METIAYAALHKETEVRLKSSSGGVFTLLAEDVLSRGGVVFGAVVTENLQIAHIPVESMEELHRLRGSKYVRSRLGDSYARAEEYLRTGRAVLFTGTPCQIAGLKAYLKEDYVNLLCQDLVCHGAPEASVWEKYVQDREHLAGAKARSVNFRDKSTGWESYSLSMTFENGTVYRSIYWDDPYMKAFVKDLSLGNSCYRCTFKGIARQADITLADLWGAREMAPELYDGKGTSAVLVHTEKGKEALGRIEDRLRLQPLDAQKAAAHNPSMLRPASKPETREAFWKALETEDFATVAQRYCPRDPLGKRLFAKLKGIAKKILGR